MRVGVISDVHANLVALEAVLADLPPVDALVCAGDVVGYNPWPAECVEALREPARVLGEAGNPDALPDDHGEVPTVMGNHDRKVARGTNYRANQMARAGITHAQERLSDGQRDWLAGLPVERRLFDDRLAVVHGHPDDPDRYTYPESFGPDLLDGTDALVMGHTHVQHHERYPDGVVLNPGSVGQPRDDDPRAAYALLDLSVPSVEERRVEYDVAAVQQAVREAGLPEGTAERLVDGR